MRFHIASVVALFAAISGAECLIVPSSMMDCHSSDGIVFGGECYTFGTADCEGADDTCNQTSSGIPCKDVNGTMQCKQGDAWAQKEHLFHYDKVVATSPPGLTSYKNEPEIACTVEEKCALNCVNLNQADPANWVCKGDGGDTRRKGKHTPTLPDGSPCPSL